MGSIHDDFADRLAITTVQGHTSRSTSDPRGQRAFIARAVPFVTIRLDLATCPDLPVWLATVRHSTPRSASQAEYSRKRMHPGWPDAPLTRR
jgi:hypothetical protein